MSVKLVVVALLAAAATVAIADDPAQEPKKLTVMKGCNSNACTDCKTEYELGKCVEKDVSDSGDGTTKKYYKAMCDAQGAATLTEFASQEECNKPAGQGTPVTLPPKECTEETSDSGKYHKHEVVCPTPGNGGDNPDVPVYNGPIIFVKKSCDENCDNCNVQHQEAYQANGTCFKVMPAGGPSGSQQGAGANRRAQGQEDTQKYYKAECDNLKVTFYTDDTCTTQDGQETTYPKVCDTSKKIIAECRDTSNPGGSTSADNSSSPGDNSSSPGDNSSSPGDNSSSPGDDGSSGGSPGGSGGSGGSSGSSDDSSNNSTEGLGVSAVHSVGAFAVALLAMALMC